MPNALVTGITGQDGLYLAEFLIDKGYRIFGLVRGQSNPRLEDVQSHAPEIVPIPGDLTDFPSLVTALQIAQPHEVYNLASMSFVGMSWREPDLTSRVTGLGVLSLLEAIRMHTSGSMESIRFFQASSSEMFGNNGHQLQNEQTILRPRSPYGIAKAFGHHTTVNYRESYGAYACNGIMFNHESPRRGVEFVTRKITRAVARIALGLQEELVLGNLDISRDWGYARDYVAAMWSILQQDVPDDYVIATGKAHTIRELLTVAFEYVNIPNWTSYVRQDPALFRPAEVHHLVGDASKALRKFGWKPTTRFGPLIRMMIDHDLDLEGGLTRREWPCSSQIANRRLL
jgi:GDPmannose 4,6-dehydratase